MWVPRTLAPELRRLADSFPVVVLTGPRQVGKTALLERSFPTHRFVALDAGQNAETAETRPGEFLDAHAPPVILDEIQYAPRLLRDIKARVDRRREPGQYLLTGSQTFPLMQSVSESLAGRAAVVPLLGLSADEWLSVPELAAAHVPSEFLWRGSYPGLWAPDDSAPTRDRWYQGYVATYLERDVRNLLNVARLRDFERFLRACAARTGQLLNMSELGRDVGVSATTAREWISVLLTSGQIVLLEPYHRSLGKRLVKSPKLYFADTGLAAWLAGFQSAGALLHSPAIGAFWENHVVGQWIRYRDWHAPAVQLWFWQDRTGREVDLLIETDQRLVPVECKWKERPDHGDAAGIRRLRAFYGDAVAEGFIACTTATAFQVTPGVTAVPGWRLRPASSGDLAEMMTAMFTP
ncbi:MAG: ATP-binding protein [Acidobacteria bacterium]|nr:ATP-binding protein [Acidobacteriota bacterium]